MTLAEDTFASSRFSAADLPPGQRMTAYREMLERATANLEAEAIGDEFDFSATAFNLPGLGVTHIASSALRVARTREMPEDDTRDLFLVVFHDGTAVAAQRGREATIEAGGAFLASSHDAFLVQRTAARVTTYSLLSSNLAPAVSNLDGALLTPLNSDAIRLLAGYTALLFKDGAPAPAEFRRVAVSHIHDLIALAIGATREAAEIAKRRGLSAARRAELYARANRLITLRLDDPDLAPDGMADQLRVSSRHLQKIFAERGETVMTRLWDERVTRAARLLSAPETADRSVTDIAFACGFNDSSHFGRVFAERKGMTPSRWRKQARASSAIESPPDRRAYN